MKRALLIALVAVLALSLPAAAVVRNITGDPVNIVGSLSINSAYTFPTADGTADQLLTAHGDGSPTWEDATSFSYWQRVSTVLSPATAGDTVELAQTSTTGSALQVTRDLASASTDSPMIYARQDNIGDDQAALHVYQDSPSAPAGAFTATSSSTPAYAVTASANGGTGLLGTSSSGTGIRCYGGSDNDDYGLKSTSGICTTYLDYDEQTPGTPRITSPEAGLARLAYFTDDLYTAINDAGKAYSWTDADGDTIIAVEESADEDTVRIDAGGTQMFRTSASGTWLGDNGAGNLLYFDTSAASDYRIYYTASLVDFNYGASDFDMRVRGDTDTDLLYLDAGNDRVGVSTSTPGSTLEVLGTAEMTYGLVNQYVDFSASPTSPVPDPTGAVRLYCDPTSAKRMYATDPSSVDYDLTVASKQTWYMRAGISSGTPLIGYYFDYSPYEAAGANQSVGFAEVKTAPSSIGGAPDQDQSYAFWYWEASATFTGSWVVDQYQVVMIISANQFGDTIRVALKDSCNDPALFEDVYVWVQDGDGGTTSSERINVLSYTLSSSWAEHNSSETDISGFSNGSFRILIVVAGKDYTEEKVSEATRYALEWVSLEQWPD